MSVERVLEALRPETGPADERSIRAVGGGSINSSYSFDARDGSRYFLKLNAADKLDMFTAERDGLLELAAAEAVRVPEPIATGIAGTRSYLLMEALDLGGHSGTAAAELGRRLACQHRTVRDEFGWHRDNTIGSTPQPNGRMPHWVEFLRDRRLAYQLQLAVRNGIASHVAERGEELLDRLPDFFTDYEPDASVLHGDLWGGNWGITADGEPVIFDPAVYFGDREADIAMTMLFGGFGADFLEAYQSEWPLDPGFRRRVDLYNLYHVLNHYNLFGGGYQQQAAAMLDGLLA
jgi:fructosamine-3-kinase